MSGYRLRLQISLVILVVAVAALLVTSRTRNSRAADSKEKVAPVFKSSSVSSSNSSSDSDSDSGSNSNSEAPEEVDRQNSIAGESFNLQFDREARAIGAIDEQPEQTEKRLRKWASRISPAEFAGLEARALNPELSGDDRFLAVQLLGWSEHSHAISNLENIALASIPPLKDERRLTFENALRGLAIESIGTVGPVESRLAALARIADKTEQTFLGDRARRTLLSLRNSEVESPAEQDRRALSQLFGP